MKLYDFDSMFNEKLSEYMEKHPEYKEKEWENIIPALYRKFGETVIKSIGKSPVGFYRDLNDKELFQTLKEHLTQGVPVPSYLFEEVETRDLAERLITLLDEDEEVAFYAVNLIGSDERAFDKYISMIAGDYTCELKDAVADMLKDNADPVKDKALEYYKNGVEKEYMLEILSRTTGCDDEIFQILLDAFLNEPDDIPMHASYLAAFGDTRALPHLLEQIKDMSINYVEFTELLYAIEALGGEYREVRDFSDDPYYQEIMATSAKQPNPFGGFKM